LMFDRNQFMPNHALHRSSQGVPAALDVTL
jgi:hypothetical protein